jgi:hypothetical protein
MYAGGLRKKRFSAYHADIRRAVKHMKKMTSIHSKIVGTSSYERFRYFGDVDLMSTLDPKRLDDLATQIQTLVRNLPGDVQFGDLKAGKGRRAFHWTKRQVLSGRRQGVALAAALRQSTITKIDLYIPVKYNRHTRYVEMTNFFFIPGISKPFGDFVEEMEHDIVKYTKKNRKLKVLKRRLSQLIWTNKKADQGRIKEIRKILTGKAGKLAALFADCELVPHLAPAFRAKHLDWLSFSVGKKVTSRNVKAVMQDLQREINALA